MGSVTRHQPVRVLVVDDLPAFRRAAACVIAVTDGFVLAGEAGSGEEAITLQEELVARLVLMDVNMPGMGGIRAAQEIQHRFPDVVVVLLSIHPEEDLPPAAASCGVRFCHKERFDPEQLEELWEGAGGGDSA